MKQNKSLSSKVIFELTNFSDDGELLWCNINTPDLLYDLHKVICIFKACNMIDIHDDYDDFLTLFNFSGVDIDALEQVVGIENKGNEKIGEIETFHDYVFHFNYLEKVFKTEADNIEKNLPLLAKVLNIEFDPSLLEIYEEEKQNPDPYLYGVFEEYIDRMDKVLEKLLFESLNPSFLLFNTYSEWIEAIKPVLFYVVNYYFLFINDDDSVNKESFHIKSFFHDDLLNYLLEEPSFESNKDKFLERCFRKEKYNLYHHYWR